MSFVKSYLNAPKFSTAATIMDIFLSMKWGIFIIHCVKKYIYNFLESQLEFVSKQQCCHCQSRGSPANDPQSART